MTISTDSHNWQGIMEKVRRTATARGRVASGYFSIEGTRLHERALRAGISVEEAVVAEQYGRDQPVDADAVALVVAGDRVLSPGVRHLDIAPARVIADHDHEVA